MDEDRKKFQGFGFWGFHRLWAYFYAFLELLKPELIHLGVEPPLNTPMAWRLILHQ